ncbi:CARDB domain-containing protein [Patescibacteria group bacterium]
MKILLKVFCLMLFVVNSTAYAANPSDCVLYDVGCIKGQFNLGASSSDVGTWAPNKGVIFYYGGNNMFQVFLHFDSAAISFYQNNPWAGLEIDINFPDSIFGEIKIITSNSIKGPEDTNPLRDTIISLPGEDPTRGLTVINPSAMSAGWNTFSFLLLGNVPDDTRIKASIQIVANASHSQFMSILYEENDNQWAYYHLYDWLVVHNLGYNFSFGNEVFKYFLMDKFDQAPDRNFGDIIISSTTNGEGLCWSSVDPSVLAVSCNASNFLSIVNESTTPDDNSIQENTNTSNISDEALEDCIDGESDCSFGSGYETQPTDNEDPGEPNFIIEEVWLETSGSTEQYSYDQDQTIRACARLKSNGDADCNTDYIKTGFYLSDGYKEDSSSERVFLEYETTQCYNLEQDDTHTECIEFNAPNEPGKVFNIVASADDTEKVTEKHESDNYSTEAVFTVNSYFDFTINSFSISPSDGKFKPTETFSATVVVKNNGDDAQQDIKIGYYVTGGAYKDNSVLIDTDNIAYYNFKEGDTKEETLTGIQVPSSAKQYYIYACVDYDSQVTETNEFNNCSIPIPFIMDDYAWMTQVIDMIMN